MAKRKKKPPVLMIVAIMNILIALPCMCCLGTNAVVLMAMPPGQAANQPKPAANNPFGQAMAQQGEQLAFIAKESPGYMAEQITYNLVAVLVSIGLLISAIGLFMAQSWGRLVCMAACAVMILAAVANTIYTAAFIMPAAKKWHLQQVQKGGTPPPPQGAFAAGGIIGIAGVLLVGAGYPALAIGLLMTTPVRSYFSGAVRRPREDDDLDDEFDRRAEDDDYDDDRPRPRRRADDDYDR